LHRAWGKKEILSGGKGGKKKKEKEGGREGKREGRGRREEVQQY